MYVFGKESGYPFFQPIDINPTYSLSIKYMYLGGVLNYNEDIFNTNLHIFDTETMDWTSQSIVTNQPPIRSLHSAAISGNYMFIFGGNFIQRISIPIC